MPVKGIDQVNQKLDQLGRDVIPEKAERSLYVAATIGAGYASLMTPIDTSLLVNSQYIQTSQTVTGPIAKIGYTAAYAAAVHNIKTNPIVPRPRQSGNGFTWDPNGEPYFLTNGFEQNQAEIFEAFKRAMKL